MAPQRFVPDASVILKWVLPRDNEPHTDRARALRDTFVRGECDLCVPSLWLFEVGNILALKYPAHAAAILDSLCALELTVQAIDGRCRALAMELATTCGVTFYDASYHAVAMQTGSVLLTADVRYVRRVESAGAIGLLSDWVPV